MPPKASRSTKPSTAATATGSTTGVRGHYVASAGGAEQWYRETGDSYANPHATVVRSLIVWAAQNWAELATIIADPAEGATILDLSCGAGEATLALRDCGIDADRIVGCDPYTSSAYLANVGRPVVGEWTFAEIAAGDLSECDEGRFDLIVCSYAMHLCEQSRLAGLCAALADLTDTLLILTPHKRPELRPEWGFSLTQEHRDPDIGTRIRLYSRL